VNQHWLAFLLTVHSKPHPSNTHGWAQDLIEQALIHYKAFVVAGQRSGVFLPSASYNPFIFTIRTVVFFNTICVAILLVLF